MDAMLTSCASATAAAPPPLASAAGTLGSVEWYALALLLAYVLHVLAVAGLIVRRGHPAWLGLAYGLLPGIGLAAAFTLPEGRQLRQQEREGLHLVAAAQQSGERGRYALRALLLAGIGVVVLMFVHRGSERLDLTANQRHTLDPVVRLVLEEIGRYEPVLRVRYFYSPASVRPQRFATLHREMEELLREYKRYGGERFEFEMIEVPQVGARQAGTELDEETGDFGLLGAEADDEANDESLSEAERERRQILREVRDRGIRPILDESTDSGRTEQLRYYSALHVAYGEAGEDVLDRITVSREQARNGQRAVDMANWELTRAIVKLMDRSIAETQPFQIRRFTLDGRVRLAGVTGFPAVGDVAVSHTGQPYRIEAIDADQRLIEVVPATADGAVEPGAEPVTVRRLPTFRYRIGFLEDHGEAHEFEGAAEARRRLEEIGFDVSFVNLNGGSQPIPEDIDVLVMTSTANALPEATRYHIDQFLLAGGSVLFAHGAMVLSEEPRNFGPPPPWPRTHSTWRRFVEPYGLRLGDRFVFDNQCFQRSSAGMFLPPAIHLRPDNLQDHPVTAGIVCSESNTTELSRFWLYGVPVQPAASGAPEGLQVEDVLRSSDASWLQEVTGGILDNPFGWGDARNPTQARNPRLMRLLLPNRGADLTSHSLAASVRGPFPSAFAGQPMPEALGPDRAMPMDIDRDGDGTADAAEANAATAAAAERADADAEETPADDTPTTPTGQRLDAAIAEGRLMVFGSNFLYPLDLGTGTGDLLENAVYYAIPDGDRLLALKAKTTAYTPIDATLHETDRTWYTAMVTLMVPIGLLIVTVLVMLSERAERLFFRARQQARRRGAAMDTAISTRQAARQQLIGGVLLGLGVLMVMIGAFGWAADPRGVVLWLLAFVLALPLAGLGLEQLAAGRRDQDQASRPRLGPLSAALGLTIVMLGLLVLYAQGQLAAYGSAALGLAIAAGIGAAVAAGFTLLGQLPARSRPAVVEYARGPSDPLPDHSDDDIDDERTEVTPQ